MAGNPSNDVILEQLRSGIANFELAASPVASVSNHCRRSSHHISSVAVSPRFFARIGNFVDGNSPAMKKVERYSVRKVTGDGRCLFRALVKGMAMNKGMSLGPREEREGADELRLAVKEVICDSQNERSQYEEALVAITVEESLKRYCQRIGRPDFWGGEPELLVLSKLCSQPIVVYIPEHEDWRLQPVISCLKAAMNLQHGGRGAGFIPIQEYGFEFLEGSKKGKLQKAVRLLYTGRNHYDLLV